MTADETHRTPVEARRGDRNGRQTVLVWRDGADVLLSLDCTWPGTVRLTRAQAVDLVSAVRVAGGLAG